MKPRLEQLTVLVITHNEEENIARTLNTLRFAGQILVVDSFSTDRTLEVVAQFANATVLQREFTSFAEQCNFGLEHVKTKWVLSIDADYYFPSQAAEIIKKAMEGRVDSHEVAFDYCIAGIPVWGSILPPRTVLYKAASATYVDDGHGHQLVNTADPGRLEFRVQHDDRKPLSRWLVAQVQYAAKEAKKIRSARFSELGINDRIRKLLFIAPIAVFLLVYVIRGGFMSGWRGLFYALQRFTAELLLSLFLIERIINRKTP